MTGKWAEIEVKQGFGGAESFTRAKLIPELQNVLLEQQTSDGYAKELKTPFTLSFILFLGGFFMLGKLLPGGTVGSVISMILFPVWFLVTFIIVFFIYRERLVGVFLRGQSRFIIRAKVLGEIASRFGLNYVPVPGGAPKFLKAFAATRFMPQEFRDMVELIDDHGGMDEACAVARQSGIMLPNTVLLGSREQKEKYRDHLSASQQLEDGFHGERAGISFDAFEWKEKVQDQADIDHLLLVFTSSTRLQGVTQLRSKGAGWPLEPPGRPLGKVSLGVKAFDKKFRLRGSDQVEARVVFNPAVIARMIDLAHGEKIRAVAYDDHIVFDIAGSPRFDIVNLTTGEWSEKSIRTTFTDLAELLDLVEAVSHAFMVKAG